jgi:hypothetical protein
VKVQTVVVGQKKELNFVQTCDRETRFSFAPREEPVHALAQSMLLLSGGAGDLDVFLRFERGEVQHLVVGAESKAKGLSVRITVGSTVLVHCRTSSSVWVTTGTRLLLLPWSNQIAVS